MAVVAIGVAITFPIYSRAGVGDVPWLVVVGIAVGIAVGIVGWFVVWCVPRLTGGFFTALAEGDGGPQGPLESWRKDRVFGLVAGLAFGLVADLTFGLVAGLVIGLTVGLTYGITSSVTWSTALAWRFQLQRSRRVPAVSLMPFLEDARGRGVLRTVGAIYQFRHATLHDHLAGHTTASPATPSAAELSV